MEHPAALAVRPRGEMELGASDVGQSGLGGPQRVPRRCLLHQNPNQQLRLRALDEELVEELARQMVVSGLPSEDGESQDGLLTKREEGRIPCGNRAEGE